MSTNMFKADYEQILDDVTRILLKFTIPLFL